MHRHAFNSGSLRRWRRSEGLVAGDRPVAGKPPKRVRHGVGDDIPANVLDEPERVHGPEVTILTLEVKDEPLRASAVRVEEGAEGGDRSFRLVTEFCEDESVG